MRYRGMLAAVLVGVTAVPHLTVSAAPMIRGGQGAWSDTGGMHTFVHLATLLPNGTVLAVEGEGNTNAQVTEVYNLKTGTWLSTGSVSLSCANPSGTSVAVGIATITLLLTHKVLATCPDGEAALYDANAGGWTQTGGMTTRHPGYTAALLQDGRVLAVGGRSCGAPTQGGGPCQLQESVSDAEVYSPTSGQWVPIRHMTAARTAPAVTLLPNGKVLVSGGVACDSHQNCRDLASAEVYDPRGDSWAPTGRMIVSHGEGYSTTPLPDGRVLVAGGCCRDGGPLADAEVYDPRTGMWRATDSLNIGRYMHTATLLVNGMVLVVGGDDGSAGSAGAGYTTSTELYDPHKGRWPLAPELRTGRASHLARLLTTGQVLVMGGMSCCDQRGESSSLTSSALYSPSSLTPSLFVRPTRGPAGRIITVMGSSWPFEPMTFYRDNLHTPLHATAVTSVTGLFMAQFRVPPSSSGNHTIIGVSQYHRTRAIGQFIAP